MLGGNAGTRRRGRRCQPSPASRWYSLPSVLPSRCRTVAVLLTYFGVMGSGLFFGGSVVAAVVAGSIALFAPCCVSVMLPAFFAASFQNRRVLVAMTFLFAAGVATVILPIALGASFVRRILLGGHTEIYVAGGALMLSLGAYTLLGGKLRLPMPSGGPTGRGPLGVYSLGLFSGVATACCAPVLAGVIALSGVTGSFLAGIGLGIAYVAGMVGPLLLIALWWDRRDWRGSALFRPRNVTYQLGPLRRSISAAALASGILLMAMGAWAVWSGFDGGMRTPTGWQADLQLRLDRAGTWLTQHLAWLPSWGAAVLLAIALVAAARIGIRQLGWNRLTTDPAVEATPIIEEDLVEHET